MGDCRINATVLGSKSSADADSKDDGEEAATSTPASSLDEEQIASLI